VRELNRDARLKRKRSGDLQVLCRRLAAIFHEVVFNNLIFIEGAEASALDRGDMDEHVPVAAIRLDESITLGRIEPFDGTLGHRLSPALDVKKDVGRASRAPRHKRASEGLLNFRVFAKRTVERPIPIVKGLQHEIGGLASL